MTININDIPQTAELVWNHYTTMRPDYLSDNGELRFDPETLENARFDIESFNPNIQAFLNYLHQQHPDFDFKLVEVFGGNFNDLVITDLKQQAAYQKNRAEELANGDTRTRGELTKKIHDELGIRKLTDDESDPTLMTQAEFDRDFEIMKSVGSIFDELRDEKNKHDSDTKSGHDITAFFD